MVGTEASFENFYRDEHTRVRASLVVATGQLDQAQDAADEAFARAYLHWNRVSTMASPTGWVYRVALNVVRRRARRSRMEAALLRRTCVRETLPAPADELWLLVADLPERQRLAVVLRFIGDLTEPQIAEVMGIKRGTVSRTLRDAQQVLGLALSDEIVSREAP